MAQLLLFHLEERPVYIGVALFSHHKGTGKRYPALASDRKGPRIWGTRYDALKEAWIHGFIYILQTALYILTYIHYMRIYSFLPAAVSITTTGWSLPYLFRYDPGMTAATCRIFLASQSWYYREPTRTYYSISGMQSGSWIDVSWLRSWLGNG